MSIFFFLPHYVACGILVPWQDIKPMPPAVEAGTPNYWSTRKVLQIPLTFILNPLLEVTVFRAKGIVCLKCKFVWPLSILNNKYIAHIKNGVLWYHFLYFWAVLFKNSEDWWHLGLHCPMGAVSWSWGVTAFLRWAHSLHPPYSLTPGLLYSCTLLSCPCSWVYILYYIHNTHKNHFILFFFTKTILK